MDLMHQQKGEFRLQQMVALLTPVLRLARQRLRGKTSRLMGVVASRRRI